MAYRALEKGWNNPNSDNYQSGWVYGSHVYLNDHAGHTSDRIYTGEAQVKSNMLVPEWMEVDPNTLCSMTDQNDKFLHTIYERDIVMLKDKSLGYVVYSGKGNGFGWFVHVEAVDPNNRASVKAYELNAVSNDVIIVGDTVHHKISGNKLEAI